LLLTVAPVAATGSRLAVAIIAKKEPAKDTDIRTRDMCYSSILLRPVLPPDLLDFIMRLSAPFATAKMQKNDKTPDSMHYLTRLIPV